MESPNWSYENETYRPLFLEWCKEQRKIDIDKACDVYRNELQEILDLFTKFGEMKGIEQLGDIISIGGSVSDFRKAMEE